ncbi:unnamed protein product, partial [Ectocarpus sp. 13 AM-2016]
MADTCWWCDDIGLATRTWQTRERLILLSENGLKRLTQLLLKLGLSAISLDGRSRSQRNECDTFPILFAIVRLRVILASLFLLTRGRKNSGANGHLVTPILEVVGRSKRTCTGSEVVRAAPMNL